MDDDKVFKALADPNRRMLLDRLCEKNGQTLGQLCETMDMKRQSVTQHLDLLEQANLISAVRRGREKWHFINPVPLYEVYERWIRKFEEGRLSLLHDLKQELKGTKNERQNPLVSSTSPSFGRRPKRYLTRSRGRTWRAATGATRMSRTTGSPARPGSTFAPMRCAPLTSWGKSSKTIRRGGWSLVGRTKARRTIPINTAASPSRSNRRATRSN
jgi:DNA-binding transcriptional ArsR family regulator